jgi:hypothetical protein
MLAVATLDLCLCPGAKTEAAECVLICGSLEGRLCPFCDEAEAPGGEWPSMMEGMPRDERLYGLLVNYPEQTKRRDTWQL